MSNAFLDLIPVVPYEDIRAAHDFLVGALAFSSGGLVEDAEGTVIHGEVRAGERRVWLHAASEEHRLAPPGATGTASGGVVVQVADVDAHFAGAKVAGATIISEPTDQEYGQREYGVRDPEGHRWWFATPFAEPAE
jgi:MerR family transcriptional regulator, thiopeptide resistance regulator